QAEDGIRDRNVTGVQTCALPISASCDSFPSRAQTRESWAIGSPNLGTIEETARVDRQRGIRPFTSGPTYDALLLILGACLVYAGVRVLHPALLLTARTDASGLVVLLLTLIAVLVLVWPMARLLWQAAKQAALPASAY